MKPLYDLLRGADNKKRAPLEFKFIDGARLSESAKAQRAEREDREKGALSTGAGEEAISTLHLRQRHRTVVKVLTVGPANAPCM